MNLLFFGMKYKGSPHILKRTAAKICISLAKKNAEREEKRLKKHNIRGLDEKAKQEMLRKIEKR